MFSLPLCSGLPVDAGPRLDPRHQPQLHRDQPRGVRRPSLLKEDQVEGKKIK